MVIIQIQVGKNFNEDVLLNGAYGVHIITKKLRVRLSCQNQNLRMADQTIAKPLGFIKDLKKIVHGIPYVMTFIII
jgi:hypothetical protein